MPRGSKVKLNRAALDDVTLALADGMFEVAKEIIRAARPPDSPFEPYPTGEGLPKQGGALVYVNGQKVGGEGLSGKQPRAPRAAKVSRGRGVVAIAGWGFPARFNEFGTIRTPAQPFFTPAVDETLPRMTEILAPIVGPRLPRP